MCSIQISNRLLSILSFGKITNVVLKPESYYYHYGQYRWFHFSPKAEQTINVLKKVGVNDEKTNQMLISTKITKINPTIHSNTSFILNNKIKSICQRLIHELKHYYNSSKLLYIETKVAFRLLYRIFNGHTLTRRERKQFNRTLSDLFRLIPFSVFIIIPFMEFTLPIFLKFFPNMLPSTFKQIEQEEENLKKQIKIKLEVTKFLQDTLKDMLSKSDKEFIIQFNIQPSNEDIIKFSSLYVNQLTLDNLSRLQLINLCKLLNLSYHGPNFYLRLKLQLKFHHLKHDDKLIVNEGIQNLNIKELQIACYERGINSLDMNIEYLQLQLEQWIDLHINKSISIIILLLTNIFHLPKNKLRNKINDNIQDFIDIDQFQIGLEQIVHEKKYRENIKYTQSITSHIKYVDKRPKMY